MTCAEISAALEAMRANPYGGDVKFLRGTGGALRRRVGSWRILFEVHQRERRVVVLGVKRRTSTTY
jgi:mRNA-degrading endonuclease RelE of RelBE toxin-antitoxin system